MSTVSESLSQLEVLVVDCQATAAAPHGHLLEMGWARAGTTTTRAEARLIALPHGEHIPAAVMRLTGISERMLRDGVDAQVAWRELSNEAATLARQPAPTIIHFARFEQPFLRTLAGGALPLDIICTHDIARRLLPDLPRCSVRALTGYFGRGVGALRRSAEHVEATAFVWREQPLKDGATLRIEFALDLRPVNGTDAGSDAGRRMRVNGFRGMCNHGRSLADRR